MITKKMSLSILETIVVNIVIYIAFFKTQPNQEVYLQLNPHPLLLLSIVMGMRYGNFLGVISATISSLFYLKVFLDVYGDITLFFLEFSNYKYILLFYWSAITLGFFRDNKEAVIVKLSNEKQLLIEEYKKLSKNYKLSEKIQKELKKQIIVSDESILNLYEIASRLETLDEEEVYTETIGVLSKYLKARGVAIYTFNEESSFLRPKIYIGKGLANNRSLSIKESIGFNKVVNEKVAVRWSDVKEDGFPLMSAPIIKENKVIAVVNIEEMDFDSLSEYAFQLFKLIVDWVNKALDKAIFVDGLKASKYIEGTKLLKNEAFSDRLKAEERRKKEFTMDYCYLKYKIRGLDIMEINSKFQSVLRTVDVIGYDIDTKTVSIILPATSEENLHLVDNRIRKSLIEYIVDNNQVESIL